MSEETTAPSAPAAPTSKQIDSVILRSYPKIVFLWPSFIVSLVAGIFMLFAGAAENAGTVVVSWTFLIVLSVNLVVLSFDFPRATSLTLFFVCVAVVLGAVLVIINFPDVLPAFTDLLKSIHPRANATFYLVFSTVMAIIFVGVAINARFDYWEVRPNELLHHHGVLSDLERYPSPHLRIEKEINDVFEYMLLGSGRLILHPSSERRAIVLENVFWISHKENLITRLLGALQVQVRENK
ncbi:hypothetical protein Mal4_06570 [Maioricimonas rarisocia]|uniref:Uncharacterized protein n=1 Tax=Maioricimonas rarisocia TaxID=2528026 RepID=A0A517Z1L5_9PLAN|nr:hypothetical protein [Maioricimonas rarisocia]QDU36372.1 hypothetical protein Mal4_06570 [Maioricimonas rarisocia]